VPPSERDLDDLMARLADGDRSAFEPLFVALYPRAVAAARRRLDAQAAADTAQSTMLKVFARASEFARGSPVLPWFYAVAANEVRATMRRARSYAPLEEASGQALASSRPDPERAAIHRELSEALRKAIEELDPEAAEAIAAMIGEGERPDVAAPAFRKRVSRAYAKLRVLLGGDSER